MCIEWDGGSHLIKFNKSLINPLIVKGWEDIESYHGFPKDVEVEFSYDGSNLLGIKSVNIADFPSSIPFFHSRSDEPAKISALMFILVTLRLERRNWLSR